MTGILLVDKPSGWTSNDVVAKLKGVLHERRIGHAGTLDPLATGLLTVFVGRATRAVRFAEADSKSYVAELKLGITTDTQDVTGTVLSTCPDIPPFSMVEATANQFNGSIQQIPPMYSALKVNGRRLYDLARAGITVERQSRPVDIYSIKVCPCDNQGSTACPDRYVMQVDCSKGTYIRTLCHDLGQKLGCGGTMTALRRIRVGNFTINHAHTMDQILQSAEHGQIDSLLLPVDALFSYASSVTADAVQEKKIRDGNVTAFHVPDGPYRVYSQQGEFLMLGDCRNGIMRLVRSFYEIERKG